MRIIALLLLAGSLQTILFSAGPPEMPSPPRTPEQEANTFQLAPGLKMELVASEPMVQDPVAMSFDEKGRLWVVEMRGFMLNLDRDDEDKPSGRVSILEDTDGDGRMDKATVFLDGLVLPRAIAIVKGGILIAENKPLWFVEIGPDGKAGKKTLIDAEYGGTGMPEHSGNGLLRAMDNWYYNAKSRSRYRLAGDKWLREETEFRGQWGICEDDWGRLYYNYNWSQLHGDLVPPNYLSRNPHHTPTSGISVGIATNQSVYPIRPTPAVNRGYLPGALDEQGRSVEFTSACAPLIYRGDALPREFHGNAFVCEPAANLVRRNVLKGDALKPGVAVMHERREFLASTDERFRPVFLAEGPDGALYVTDMYRGVIQHGAYMTPYLRKQSIERGLVEPVHLGRIWRIVPESWKSAKARTMEEASVAELTKDLTSSNGWRRDTAQRLLVERGDGSAIAPLREIALKANDAVEKTHALWTLAGLHDPEPERLFGLLHDSNSKVQATAIRVLEGLTGGSRVLRARLARELAGLPGTANEELQLQATLTAGSIGGEEVMSMLARIISGHADQPIFRDAVMSGLADHELEFLDRVPAGPDRGGETPGSAAFIESLASAVIRSGKAADIQTLIEKLDRVPSTFGKQEQAILAGIAVHAGRRDYQPIQLEKAPGLLSRLDQFNDRAVHGRIEKLGSMFAWPGHQPAKTAGVQGTPLTEKEEKLFVQGRQQYVTICAGCHGPDGAGLEPQGPPLLDSNWVLGPEERLIRILLHGLEGPINVNGTRFEPPRILTEMPSLAALDNENIAAALTYIRHEWGHAAKPISPGVVGGTRTRTQGRVRPWTENELLAIPAGRRETKPESSN